MTNTQPSKHPYVMSFPFLALRGPFTVGQWKVMPFNDALKDEDWLSDDFKQDTKALLGAFRYGICHDRLKNPTVVARIEDGITGEQPSSTERRALVDAVAFAALDTNGERTYDGFTPWLVTENLDYWEFPATNDRDFSMISGRRVPVRRMGSWGEDTPIIGPSVLEAAHGRHARIEEHVAQTVYEALLHGGDRSKKLHTVIQLFLDSWRNYSIMGSFGDWPYEWGNIICAQQQALEASWSREKPSHIPARKFIAEEFLLLKQQADDLMNSDQKMPAWFEDCWFSCATYKLDEDAVHAWVEPFVDVRNDAIHEGDPAKSINNDHAKIVKLADTADVVLRCTIKLMAALIRVGSEAC